MKNLIISLTALLVTIVLRADPPSENGKTIFQARCAACHNVHKQLTGPALAGVSDRRSTEWIINFVKSSQSVIRSGDKDAVALFESFNKIPMPDHKDLTEEDITSIIEYINLETKSAVPVKKTIKKESKSFSFSSYGYPHLVLVLIVVAMLFATIYLAIYARSYRKRLYGS